MHTRSSNQSAAYLGLLCLGSTGISLSFTSLFALSFCFCFRFCSLLLGGSLFINVEGVKQIFNRDEISYFLFSSENLEREVHSNVPLKASHSLTLSLAAALAAFSSAFLASAWIFS